MKKVVISIIAILGIGYLGKKELDKGKEKLRIADEELRKLGKYE